MYVPRCGFLPQRSGRWLPRSVPLKPREAGVADDREQPGTPVAAMKAIDELVGAQQRFLDHIFRVAILTREPVRQVVGGIQMWQDNPLKTREWIFSSQAIGYS